MTDATLVFQAIDAGDAKDADQLLGLSVSTMKNYWAFSRAWLFNEIRK